MMNHNFEAQRASTVQVWKELSRKSGLPVTAVLDLQFVPKERGVDWGAFERQLAAAGYQTERYDDGNTLEASIGPIDLDLDTIWHHECKTSKIAIEFGFLPDGWGFFFK